jgi:hypothetical protein
MDNRVISFSVQPTDIEAGKEIKKLKEHCKKKGISFSFMVIKAIIKLNRELKV